MCNTTKLYSELIQAYNYYNETLFSNKLDSCIITLHRDKKSLGYYVPAIWAETTDTAGTVAEIALNPSYFVSRSTEATLSTLVHEMCHKYHQDHVGNVPRKGYHNKVFSDIMNDVGLQTSHDGTVNGRTVGQSMSHYIIEDAPFAIETKKLLDSGFKLSYVDTWKQDTAVKKKKAAASKTKYTCNGCDTNVWAKPDTSIICGSCHTLSGETIFLTAVAT